jgi:hypothetical protein
MAAKLERFLVYWSSKTNSFNIGSTSLPKISQQEFEELVELVIGS